MTSVGRRPFPSSTQPRTSKRSVKYFPDHQKRILTPEEKKTKQTKHQTPSFLKKHMPPAHEMTTENPIEHPPPYSLFTHPEKRLIVFLASYAAWFSTLTSFIYYPVLLALATHFSVPVSDINLTVTSYMAVATIAPTFVGDAADVWGRRPVYVVALSLYVGANVAIVLAGTITIAPSLGPILGGGLSYAAGWTWIFWFLSIAAGSCLLMMLFFLPETSRNIVGNGSIRPPQHLQLPLITFMCHWNVNEAVPDRKGRIPNPFKSLTILTRKDNAIIILACGILYVVYTCINTSLSVLFIQIYQLNQWQAGLIYLPFGLGGTVSTFFSGPLLNKAYRNARTVRSLPTDKAIGDDLDEFPVEKARLNVVWVPMLMTTCSVLAFGWVLHYHQVGAPATDFHCA
ncbi:hypothetical protein ACLMJK_006238 [Lecanora helva]